MRQNRFGEDQIISILNEGYAKFSHEICSKYNISHTTYYKWKSKYSGLEAGDLKNIKQLKNENHHLNKMYVQACFEQKILQEAISGNLE